MKLRENWRVILLLIFVSVAVVALVFPGGIMGDDSFVEEDPENQTIAEQYLNLEYGLGLDGGTRISAPVIGLTAENVDLDPEGEFPVDPERESDVESTLTEELDLATADASVTANEEAGVYDVEVFDENVTESEFADALQTADVDASEDDIREGVTQQTRDEIIDTIQLKINEEGLSGGNAYQAAGVGGQYYIVTEVPDMSPSELRELLSERGQVEVQAHYPGGEGGSQVNETVLVEDDFDDIDSATYSQENGYHVPVSITSDKAPEYEEQMREMGFSNEGVGQCQVRDPQTDEFDFTDERADYCLLTVVDGEVVDAHGMNPGLAQSMESGEWSSSPSFIMGAPDQQAAQTLAIHLQAGSLRAPLDFGADQTFSLEPALADQFKTYSLLIGVLSVLTVSGMVYLRYTDVRVAAPMVITALSEVVILLGFVALIRMPMDLSHVAGFIAVVGTGVDDLIIIADEVMDEGDVNSRKVFESRFRKAFWIIGAAAATTIIAMSPLAVLSLGDLRGFAIITILGVLVGVLVTRPAYGDILRYLLTDK